MHANSESPGNRRVRAYWRQAEQRKARRIKSSQYRQKKIWLLWTTNGCLNERQTRYKSTGHIALSGNNHAAADSDPTPPAANVPTALHPISPSRQFPP